MDKKLTDSEIVKAKELIKKVKEAYDFYYDVSKSMPYDIDTTLRETAICFENCLNEINRLQAELEQYAKEQHDLMCEVNRLRADCENYKQVAEHQQSVTMDRGFEINRLKEKVESLQAENERLKSKLEPPGFEGADPMDFCGVLCDFAEGLIKKAKAEAYKECVEKAKENCEVCEVDGELKVVITETILNNLLKELVGEENV